MRRTLAGLAGLYLFAVAFPGLPIRVTAGLDPSWIYGINQAAAQHLVFGTQILYTAGPLGYLLYPQDIGNNLVEALFFGIALAAATAALAAYGIARSGGLVRGVLSVAGLTAALRLAPWSEQRVLLPVLLALAVALRAERAHALIAAAIVVSAAALLMKVSTGVSCLSTVCVYLIIQAARRRLTVRHAAACAITYAMAVALLFVLSGNRLGALGPFLSNSFQLVLGYSDAMSLPGRGTEVMLAVACLILCAALAIGSANPMLRLVALLLVPVLLPAYKHAFVRHDPLHVLVFFGAFLGGLAVLALVARGVRDTALIAAGLLLGFASAVAIKSDHHLNVQPVALFDPMAGIDRMRQYAEWSGVRARTAAESAQGLQPLVLPSALRARLQAGTVDVVPSETAYVAANGLRWNPRPAFQSFAVMTEAIDTQNAAHFLSSDAPDYVLYSFDALDAQHAFFAEPAALRALVCHYTIDQRDGDLLVLRRAAPRCGAMRAGERRTVQWNEEIPLPPEQAGLHVALDIRYRWPGLLRRLLLRSPTVMLAVTYVDGTQARYRFTPRLAHNGLWIGNLPRDLDGVQGLLTGQPPPAVRSFHLISEPPGWFAARVPVVFARLPLDPSG